MTLDESLEKRGPVRGREPEGQAWCVGLHRLGTTGAKGGLEEVLGSIVGFCWTYDMRIGGKGRYTR